jgi:hypothetical protein
MERTEHTNKSPKLRFLFPTQPIHSTTNETFKRWRRGCRSHPGRGWPWWSSGRAYRRRYRAQSVLQVVLAKRFPPKHKQVLLLRDGDPDSDPPIHRIAARFIGFFSLSRSPKSRDAAKMVVIRCYQRSGGHCTWQAWSSTRAPTCGEGGCCLFACC